MTKDFPHVSFLLSAARLDQAPPDSGTEVAFAGRSNAGKSSALNTISGQHKLARTSRTPGRTQLLNFFHLGSAADRRLVDLPGYGFARVPPRVKRQWDELLSGYLEKRRSLTGLVLIIDSRHPIKPFDQQMLNWCHQAGLPVHVLLTKADKLSRNRAHAALQQLHKYLNQHKISATAQLFSATERLGVEQVRDQLLHWLEAKKSPGTEGGVRTGA
jgi:GTP-binding protein